MQSKKSVGSCDALIAVVGRNWMTSADKEGRRRLDNAEDWVRMEIATALKRGVRVIPVLVDDAIMPLSTELPDDLKLLVADRRSKSDMIVLTMIVSDLSPRWSGLWKQRGLSSRKRAPRLTS